MFNKSTYNKCFLKKGCGGLLGMLFGFGGGGLFGLSLLMGEGRTRWYTKYKIFNIY